MRYEGIAFYVLPNIPLVMIFTPVFRFWSPSFRHHFYTADWEEGQAVINNYSDDIWTFEGHGFRVILLVGDPGAPMINAKDCGDFSNWYEANTWFQYYYPDLRRCRDSMTDATSTRELVRAP